MEALWLAVEWLLVSSWLPGSGHRRWLLRLFGARIGTGVVLKPRLRVKFPWRLEIGDDSWIGEDVWIDNLAEVKIAGNCCISQRVYLCTGSHDWSKPSFDLKTVPITIEEGVWISACCSVGPGVTVGEAAVLTLGSVATQNLEAMKIYSGVPAVPVGDRIIKGASGK